MYSYFRLLSSSAGRMLRIATGIVMIAIGFLWDDIGSLSWLLIIPGLFTLLAAILNVCLLAPLFGLSLFGSDLRRSGIKRRDNNHQLVSLTYVGENLRRSSDSDNQD